MERLRKRVKDFSLKDMNRLLIAILCVAMVTSCKEEKTGEITSDDIYFDNGYDQAIQKNLPQIDFTEEDFDFGIIIEGEKVSHTYKFKNGGKSDLIISDVQPSCGCTTSKDFTKEPIEPGAVGQIKVEFDSTDKPGDIKKAITVITNCKPNKTILYITGQVINTDNLENLEELNEQ
ncbi:MAG: DUF1573 domain-containing protein [Flavobacteriales bacterium]